MEMVIGYGRYGDSRFIARGGCVQGSNLSLGICLLWAQVWSKSALVVFSLFVCLSFCMSTGRRKLKNMSVKNYFGEFSRNLSGYFSGFPFKIQVSEPDRKFREGLSLTSSKFHPNPTTGSPQSVKNVIPRDIF